jgi:hypothetical protein
MDIFDSYRLCKGRARGNMARNEVENQGSPAAMQTPCEFYAHSIKKIFIEVFIAG